MKIEMSIPILVTQIHKGKAVLTMGGKQYVVEAGDTLTVNFEGSVR